ncbi:MAG TPA: hypothetical protein VJ436_02475 [Anaerolineales bacterium]|nr:hypothetical protein [Anaerolineales bacterium]
MSDNLDGLLKRIQAIMPVLEIKQLERNQEGLINEVVIVNQEFVFRFARNENYARLLEVDKIYPLLQVYQIQWA